jgi:hypothetical protein
MKRVIYYEEAKRLYVNEGFSLDAIVEMLKKNISRKTLYNWKVEFNWDEERKKYLKSAKSIEEDLQEIARLVIQEAKANPTAHNIYALVKAISALKTFKSTPQSSSDEQVPEDKLKPKQISIETIETIERDILGLNPPNKP